jgi:hypothetical protein
MEIQALQRVQIVCLKMANVVTSPVGAGGTFNGTIIKSAWALKLHRF